MLIINPKRKISEIDPMIYGQFIEHFHRQIYGGVYDPESQYADEDGFRSDVLEAMKKIKVPILRWPGGCFVSAYHWYDGVGAKREPVYNKAWREVDPNTFGTDEYVKLCRKIGCRPYICTNAGTGSSEEMSDWVEYCNLPAGSKYSNMRAAGGNEKPHGVKYWSIGNENYGHWEMGAKSAKEWGRLVLESAKMMKRVDPSIELSAAALNDMDWNAELLKNCGDRLDWISLHGYWDFHQGKNQLEDYDTCINYIRDLEKPVRQVKGLLTALGHDHIRIAYDEWNLRAWYHPNIMDLYQGLTEDEYLTPRNDNDLNSQYTMADGVFTAAFLNMCIRNSNIIGMAAFSPIVNTRGMIYTYEDGIVLRPTYHVFDLYVNEMESNYIDMYSDGDIPQGVDMAATADDTGSRISIGLVNTDRTSDKQIELKLDGLIREGAKYRLLTVNGESENSYNDVDRQEVGIRTGKWKDIPGESTDAVNRLELQLEPHSVNVLQIHMTA